MPAKGKKFSKTYTNPKTGRKNTVSYGAKGYKIKPGTSAGDSYCARSMGIAKKAGQDCSGSDRNSPNCLSRRKWKCKGGKSVKETIDGMLNDMMTVSFKSDKDGSLDILPDQPGASRESEIANQILCLAQELISLTGSNQRICDLEFEPVA